MASGVNTTFRQLGLVTGIAGLGAVFQHQVRTHVAELLTGTPGAPVIKPFGNAVAAGGTQAFIKHSPVNGRGPLFHAAEVSFRAGFHDILLLGGAAALVGAVFGLILVRSRDLVAAGPPQAGPEPPTPLAAPTRRRVSTAAAEAAVVLIALGLAFVAGLAGWAVGHVGRATSARTVTVFTSSGPATTGATTTGTTPASGGNPAAGKSVFASAGCAGCHTLKAAGATGTVGPNLDQKKPALALVLDRVTHGKGAMPSFGSQLTAQQIKDVAAFVVQSTSGG